MIAAFALFLVLVVLCLVTDHSLVWALLLGAVPFVYLGRRKGFCWTQLWDMAWAKGRESLIVVPIFLSIGMVTALWRSSGTIAFFLYHGLRSISPAWFVLMSFLICAALSFLLGTSFGVTGTAGVVLISLARTGGVSLPVAAGAILSGAYFGDRCSPMSSCAALVAACTDTDLYTNVKEMLRTGLLPTVLATAFYALQALRHPLDSVDPAVLETLRTSFSLSWATVLPALVMLVFPLLRVPLLTSVATSGVLAFGLSVLLQGVAPLQAVRFALAGYAPAQEALAAILSGGGLLSMVEAGLVVFCTSLLAGLLGGIEALEPVYQWVEKSSRKLGLYPTSVLLSFACVSIFCNQSVTNLIQAQLMGDLYEKQGASRLELAMDIANSGVVLAGLGPWSLAISVPLTILDVPVHTILYAALLYLIPLCYLFTKRFYRVGQNREKAV